MMPLGTALQLIEASRDHGQSLQKSFEGDSRQKPFDQALPVQSPKLSVVRISAHDWDGFSEAAHLAVFDKDKPASADRIDYALLGINESTDSPVGYVTSRELNADSIYYQFGGTLAGTRKTLYAIRVFDLFIAWEKARGIKRISLKIENINKAMFKYAISRDFIICGCGHYKGETLVSLVKEL